ncbi:MAG: primosomal protein N' [Bacilli bacterium]|nr:primosomal protein N' [Bacilli bacterium]
MIASVLIEYSVKSLNKTFDYLVSNELSNKLKIGHKVLVPFGNSKVEGFVLNIHNKKEDLDYKEIIKIIEEEFYLNEELLELGKYISQKTFSNLISAYQIMLPKALKASNKTKINKKTITYIELNDKDISEYIENNKRRIIDIEILNDLIKNKRILKNKYNSQNVKRLLELGYIKEIKEEINREVDYIKENKKNIVLNDEQENAYKEIINSKEKKILLYGVTGSGKTEVYIKVIKNVLSKNKEVILLVPEISLTPQIISRFKSEFNDNVAVLHSALSDGEKFDEYRKIMRGEVKIVIGARSAVFAPLKNIGAIIIDECQSSAYKQDSNPRYDGLDVALKRCEYHNAKFILGSATPSLIDYAKGEKGVYKLISLKNRINASKLKVTLVDMEKEVKKRNFIISDELNMKILERLSKKEQIIIMLNRRGYSTFISCSSCGFVYKCPNCDISLIYHKSTNNLRCHYCGYNQKLLEHCPICKEKAIKDLGLGTEKLENILKEKYKTAKVLRMDQDTTSAKGAHQKLIESFKNKEYDILIGTQMISKGLNFPDVTLVAVINADASLAIPDYKSGEKTFELLMQTGGRSGRNEKPGEVLIQTYNPDNYVLKFIKNYDFVSFYKYEMDIRRRLKYPPYFYMISIKVISNDYNLARDESIKIQKYLVQNLNETFIVLGPSTAAMFKVNNNYHFQILIKYKKEYNLTEVLNFINENNINKKIKIEIDRNI